jgi:beta-glucanase (GH16 family)
MYHLRTPRRIGVVAALIAAASTLLLSAGTGARASTTMTPKLGVTYNMSAVGPVSSSSPCGGITPAKTGGGTYRCAFDDEFNTTTLDTSKWTVVQTDQLGFPGNGECYVNNPQHVSLGGGSLALTETKGTSQCALYQTTQYNSGMIESHQKFAQRYGYFEVRAKLPAGAGFQPAFWMLPELKTYGVWPYSGEIDVVEGFTAFKGMVSPHLHYMGSTGVQTGPGAYCTISTASSAFHTYAVEWSPSKMNFLYDGKSCWSISKWSPLAPLTQPAPFDTAFYLNLQLATGYGTNAPTAATVYPSTFAIDYVRVWS